MSIPRPLTTDEMLVGLEELPPMTPYVAKLAGDVLLVAVRFAERRDAYSLFIMASVGPVEVLYNDATLFREAARRAPTSDVWVPFSTDMLRDLMLFSRQQIAFTKVDTGGEP